MNEEKTMLVIESAVKNLLFQTQQDIIEKLKTIILVTLNIPTEPTVYKAYSNIFLALDENYDWMVTYYITNSIVKETMFSNIKHEMERYNSVTRGNKEGDIYITFHKIFLTI